MGSDIKSIFEAMRRDVIESRDKREIEKYGRILQDFFMNAKQSDHRLPFFASEGVIEITNYRAM